MNPEEAMRAAAYQILEEGLFVFLDEPVGPLEDDSVSYTMEVAGGELGLRMSRPAAHTLAANMLGREADAVGPEDVDAAVAEALNMVAGPFLALLRGSELELDLGLPASGGTVRGENVGFSVDGGGLELWYAA